MSLMGNAQCQIGVETLNAMNLAMLNRAMVNVTDCGGDLQSVNHLRSLRNARLEILDSSVSNISSAESWDRI